MKIIKYIGLTVLGLVVLFFGVVFVWVYLPLYNIQVDELDTEIRKADKIVVKGLVDEHGRYSKEIIFSSSTKKDIIEFADSLVLERPSITKAGTCACSGRPKIVLFKDNKELVQITNHHGHSIRTSFWKSGLNIPIIDEEKWVTWFDKRGMPSLRKNLEDDKKRAIKNKKDKERWLEAMPQSLKKLWDKDIAMFGVGEDISEYMQLLNQNIPNKEKRILALLHWFGSGEGHWSGYHAYETVVENMLLEYRIEDITALTKKENLSITQMEGVARLFGGWHFSKKYPKGLEKVSTELKIKLWNHVKSTDDKDKLGRAERAFNRSKK